MAESFDAVVIGGDVIGASTLFQLTQLGCRRALLLDRGELAGGATAQSCGIVRTHYSVVPNVAVARASVRTLQDFSAVLDEADAGLVRSGYLILAPPGSQSTAVRGSIAMQRNLGVEARLLDPALALAQSMLGQAPDLPLHPYRITRYVEGEPLTGAYGGGAMS